MSSENGTVRWEGLCKVRISSSGGNLNVKLEGLGRMRLARSSVTYVCTYEVMVIADPSNDSASKKNRLQN